MGRDVYEKSLAGRAVFETADRVLSFPLTRVIFEGPEEELTRTDISQPAILTASIALVEAAREAGWSGEADAAAGLSLGEYTALVFAGALSFEKAVVLVNKRGAFMREAGRLNPGAMASIIGLDAAAAREIVEEASEADVLVIANFNCPGQHVISGAIPAVERASSLAESRGAMKVVRLKVDGAFHSPLMQPAAEKLAAELESTEIHEPQLPVVANLSARLVTEPDEIRRLLIEQLTGSVLWEESMRLLLARGPTSFVEIGPGRVLTGLMRRIDRKAPTQTVGDMDAVARLAEGACER
jgi:[acyl-carrier-protein] S-malonyltransferase